MYVFPKVKHLQYYNYAQSMFFDLFFWAEKCENLKNMIVLNILEKHLRNKI